MPDQYSPDEVDLMLLVDSFPSLPPIGLYLLNAGGEKVVTQLKTRFNAFRNGAHYNAVPLEGYTWICFHYNNNRWRVNGQAPNKGDNLRKFLMSFYAAAAL